MPSRPGTRNRLKHVVPARYGEDFVTTLDRRYRLSRTVYERLQGLMTDLGGEAALSHQQRSLCQRAIWAELALESEEMRYASGGGTDTALHTQLLSSLISIYRLLGIKRVARPTPRLADYLREADSTHDR